MNFCKQCKTMAVSYVDSEFCTQRCKSIYELEKSDTKPEIYDEEIFTLDKPDLDIYIANLRTFAREMDAKYKQQREHAAVLLSERNFSQNNHIEDINIISEALIKEATDRGWCDTYDTFVSNLNERLAVSLNERESEYDVTLRITRTMTQDVVIRVKSATDSDVEEIAQDVFSADPEDYIKDSEWDMDDEEVEAINVDYL